MGEDVVLFTAKLFGYPFDFTMSMAIEVIVVLFVLFLMFLFTRNLQKFPNKRQGIAELFVEKVELVIKSNMGDSYMGFVPFFGCLAVFLVLLNLTGLFGVTPPTADFNVALALGLISFLVIQGYTIKKIGLGHYFIGYAKPLAMLLPINIMERIAFPISLSLRLFGNMFAASIIMDLIYNGLMGITPVASIGIPVFFHGYFDVFDGTLQMVIFVMLTMINIKVISEH